MRCTIAPMLAHLRQAFTAPNSNRVRDAGVVWAILYPAPHVLYTWLLAVLRARKGRALASGAGLYVRIASRATSHLADNALATCELLYCQGLWEESASMLVVCQAVLSVNDA